MQKVIAAEKLIIEISKKLGLEHVRRINIDLVYDDVCTINVEFLGDERMYDIDFSSIDIKKDD